MAAEHKEKSEILLHSISVGVVLQTWNILVPQQKLIIVEDKNHNLGVPAGKLKINNNIPENPYDAAQRELLEETGFKMYQHYHIVSNSGIVFVPSVEGMRMGILYYGKEFPWVIKGERAPLSPSVGERGIIKVHEFGVTEAANLITKESHRVRKPEFNIEAINFWVRSRVRENLSLYQNSKDESEQSVFNRLNLPQLTWTRFNV